LKKTLLKIYAEKNDPMIDGRSQKIMVIALHENPRVEKSDVAERYADIQSVPIEDTPRPLFKKESHAYGKCIKFVSAAFQR